jgi:hypothetical protein
MLDALAGTGRWRTSPVHVALGGVPAVGQGANDRASELSGRIERAVDAAGWLRTRLEADAGPVDVDRSIDAIVTTDAARDVRLDPGGPIRIAAIAGGATDWLARPWFGDFDIIVVQDEATTRDIEAAGRHGPVAVMPAGSDDPVDAEQLAAVLRAAMEAWLREPKIGIRIGVPSWDVAAGWGDLHVARDLQRALGRLGRRSRIHIRSDWGSWPAARDDVSIHVLGIAEAPIRSGQLNVLWHLSHPDGASKELYERYDLAFVASDTFAAWMATQVDIPVAPLHQATDPERFAPGASGPAHELLFVANSRGVRRHILDDLLPTEHELAVYGKSWTPERLDPRYLAADHLPNDQLAGVYGAAAIVLNDHWLDMQREGFMSNRLYDAAAAGGFVISDDVEGLEAEFDGGIVGYLDAAELRRLVDHYLAHPTERRALADRARAAVLARHTFAHRARQLLDAIEPQLAERRLTITAGQSRLDAAAGAPHRAAS